MYFIVIYVIILAEKEVILQTSKKQNIRYGKDKKGNIGLQTGQRLKSIDTVRFIFILVSCCFVILFPIYSTYSEASFILLPTISSFIVLLLISAYLIFAWKKKESEFHPYTFSIFIWITVVVFIVLLLQNRTSNAYMDFFNIIPPILFMLFLLNIIKSKKDWLALAFSITILGVVLSFSGYFDFIFMNYATSFLMYPLSYNNTMAALMVLCLFTTVGFYINTNLSIVFDILVKFLIGFEVFTIFLTASRGGYLVFLISLIVFIFLTRNRIKFVFSKLLVSIVTAIILIIFLTPQNTMQLILGKTAGAINFVTSGEEASLSGRVYMMKVAFLMFLSSPLLGI